mmetsp:Transcript_8542/g.23114  ORF Transcript_8542/g.23114 Transcript_8542/m.23114 type:complete len:216 (-) Transcript_8542:1153-1800(-)
MSASDSSKDQPNGARPEREETRIVEYTSDSWRIVLERATCWMNGTYAIRSAADSPAGQASVGLSSSPSVLSSSSTGLSVWQSFSGLKSPSRALNTAFTCGGTSCSRPFLSMSANSAWRESKTLLSSLSTLKPRMAAILAEFSFSCGRMSYPLAAVLPLSYGSTLSALSTTFEAMATRSSCVSPLLKDLEKVNKRYHAYALYNLASDLVKICVSLA